MDADYAELNWRAVAARRANGRIGHPLVYRPEVDSTNLLAASLLPGARPGTVVVAGHQTAGRGRLGRRWIAPAHSSLTFTMVLGPVPSAWVVPMAIGLALVDTLAAYHISADLKWPNDLLVGGRKCAGTLIESKLVDGSYWLLAGIGLNVRAADPSLPDATYIDAHAADPVSREDLLALLLEQLEAWLDQSAADPARTRDLWKARLTTLGTDVEVQVPGGTLRGRADDVAGDGALILELADGTRTVVQAGDVTLAAVYPDR
jgi:BirA family transcriptional regulator, biotin operon repressor / biotin---[acetyl-CoA-carboxylase] ligase